MTVKQFLFKKLFSGFKTSSEQARTYDIEDLPLALYDKILKTGDLKLLIAKPGKYDPLELYQVWVNLNDDITEITGPNAIYNSYLKHKIDAIQHYKNALVDGHKWELTLAWVAEIDAAMIEETFPKSQTITENLITLSKNQGYHLRARDVTVSEYYTLIKANNHVKAS